MRGSLSELLVVVLVVAVIMLFFGAKKVPELAKSLKESKEILSEDKNEDKEENKGNK